jgi:large subunit ribosomal protein L23
MSKTITLRPRLSEKTYGLSTSRVYVMEVPTDVNKHTVARAVEAQFEVKVTSVNIMNVKGKAKRIVSLTGKRQKNAEGRRNAIKKAYVTLAAGNSLPFFDAVEEEEQQEQATQAKFDKVAEKQAAKADKKPRLSGLRRGKKADASKDDKEEDK